MDIYRLTSPCKKFLLDHHHMHILPEDVGVKELEGKQAISDFYNDHLRSFLVEDITDFTPPGITKIAGSLDLFELIIRRENAILHRRLCGVLGKDSSEVISVNALILEAGTKFQLSVTEVVSKYGPVIVPPLLSLEVCPKFSRKEVETLTKECCDFLLSMNVASPRVISEATEKLYQQSVVAKCIQDGMHQDIKYDGFLLDVNIKGWVKSRDDYALLTALVRVVRNLSCEVENRFCLYHEISVGNEYIKRLYEAYKSIGVPKDIVDEMLEKNTPKLDPIPEYKTVKKWVEVAKVTPLSLPPPLPSFPLCDKWLSSLDKKSIEDSLVKGHTLHILSTGDNQLAIVHREANKVQTPQMAARAYQCPTNGEQLFWCTDYGFVVKQDTGGGIVVVGMADSSSSPLRPPSMGEKVLAKNVALSFVPLI